jgi:hypothetical protein
MICISHEIASGCNALASDFAAAYNRDVHFLGLGMQALTDQPADQTPDRYDLETEKNGRKTCCASGPSLGSCARAARTGLTKPAHGREA